MDFCLSFFLPQSKTPRLWVCPVMSLTEMDLRKLPILDKVFTFSIITWLFTWINRSGNITDRLVRCHILFTSLGFWVWMKCLTYGDGCVSPLVQELRKKMTFKIKKIRKTEGRRNHFDPVRKTILTRALPPWGCFLIFLATVKNYYLRFGCCVLSRWASSAAPWRDGLNPTVSALCGCWLPRRRSQMFPAEREKRRVYRAF